MRRIKAGWLVFGGSGCLLALAACGGASKSSGGGSSGASGSEVEQQESPPLPPEPQWEALYRNAAEAHRRALVGWVNSTQECLRLARESARGFTWIDLCLVFFLGNTFALLVHAAVSGLAKP